MSNDHQDFQDRIRRIEERETAIVAAARENQPKEKSGLSGPSPRVRMKMLTLATCGVIAFGIPALMKRYPEKFELNLPQFMTSWDFSLEEAAQREADMQRRPSNIPQIGVRATAQAEIGLMQQVANQ